MNEIKTYTFDTLEIRTKFINNEPYFCASDVCKVLEIKNGRDAVARIEKEGVALIDTLTNGGIQKISFVNEAGLYELIFQSRKPQVKEFKKWVFSEVLPSIRKNGKYDIQQSLPSNYIEALEALVASEKEKQQLYLDNEKKQEVINEFITIDKEKNYTEVAKLLNIKPLFFINKLRTDGYITQTRLPYQKYIDNGYFVVKYRKGYTWVGAKCIESDDLSKPSFLITQKGFSYFSRKYLKSE